MKQKAKIAAAISAVMNYLYEESCAAIPLEQEIKTTQTPQIKLNLWGHSGRQEIMQMRSLMQMRAFKGTRL